MQINIGANIRRLRLSRGLTQEELERLLTVSTAAVSKWEAQKTYPDITMLLPLSHFFGTTVDELLAYDEEKSRSDVDVILSEYHRLGVEGKLLERPALIMKARKEYPYEYRIMNAYMWEKAGGNAGNSAQTLVNNKDELSQICDCILEGCTQDDIRVEAINMKAKLLHAAGDTDAALEVLSKLPAWYAPIAKERLFGRNTAEFYYWNKRNCYGLLDVMSIKLARVICYNSELSLSEKIEHINQIAEAFAQMCREEDLSFFCIGQQALYAVLAGLLTAENADADDVIRIREKQFASMKNMMALAENDSILMELIQTTYKTDDLIGWQRAYLQNTPHSQFAKMRENPYYMEMLDNYGR